MGLSAKVTPRLPRRRLSFKVFNFLFHRFFVIGLAAERMATIGIPSFAQFRTWSTSKGLYLRRKTPTSGESQTTLSVFLCVALTSSDRIFGINSIWRPNLPTG